MSLKTPDKIRSVQRKLYLKAKAEPDWRFHQLYDKVWREDILLHAWRLARSNAGSPGVDGVTFDQIEAVGLTGWLAGLQEELREKTYRPQPVRRVLIPKPGGGERPLGIPTIRDRVVQTAIKLLIEPIFEADLDDSAYGYRPRRGAVEAIRKVHNLLCQGYTAVVDADLSKYFDTIPHEALMQSVARRVVDRHLLRLIKLFLKVPVEDDDGRGGRRMSGGRKHKRGTPQGGVISPLLANLYMNRLLKHWRATGRDQAWQAQIVSYADDFVILCRRSAVPALHWTRGVLARLGLVLNEDKTRLCDARRERFDFLGYSFGPHCYRKAGRWYLGASPSHKSVQRLKTRLRGVLVPGNLGAWPKVRDRVNRILVGWSSYYGYGTRYQAYRAVDNFVSRRVRHFLRRRHKMPNRATRRLPIDAVFDQMGVVRLRDVHLRASPCASS